MKKLFLMFILLTPLAIADERVEIFISPSYGSYRGQKKNDINQEVKNVIGSGVKISFERRQPFVDDSGAGIGAGIVASVVANVAYENNFLGIKDIANEMGDNLDKGIKDVGKAFDSGIKSVQKVFGWWTWN